MFSGGPGGIPPRREPDTNFLESINPAGASQSLFFTKQESWCKK
jgi:hypothetical protein